jgi:hypothetical protein
MFITGGLVLLNTLIQLEEKPSWPGNSSREYGWPACFLVYDYVPRQGFLNSPNELHIKAMIADIALWGLILTIAYFVCEWSISKRHIRQTQ